MAYLSKDELYTHLYDEVVTEINRDNDILEFDTKNNFPAQGNPTKRYKATDTGKLWKWITNAYIETAYQDRASEAIAGAVAEARGYLKQYDIDKEFEKAGDDRNQILLILLKDIAVWHFIVIANPAVEMEVREKRYNSAIKQLEKIQQGRWNPDLPVFAAEGCKPLENFIKFGSNKKRNDYFN